MYAIEKLKEDLLGVMKGNILSLAIYGSAAIDDTSKHYSDINTLIVVQDAGLATLRLMAPFVRRWSKQGNPPPLVFSLHNLRDSQDVFSIEFHDIRSAHRIIYGTDPFSDMMPNPRAMRHQLEYELRSKMLALQKKFFEADHHPRELRSVMAKSLSSFTVLAKTVLHLAGKPAPLKKGDVWREMADLLNIDTSAVESIIGIRDNKKEALKIDADDLFGEYLALLNRMTEFVDKFDVKN